MDRYTHGRPRRTAPALALALLAAVNVAGDEPRTWAVNDAHAEAITGIAFAPDGRTLATASRDGTAKLWDLARGRARATIAVHPGRWVNAVAVSPDGSLVATGGGGGFPPPGDHPRLDFSGHLELWDAATAAHRRTIRTPANGVHRVAFSRDGRRVGTIDADGKARTWSVADGARLTETPLPANFRPAAFGPDLATLAAADDRDVLLVEVASGRETARLGGLPNRPESLAFSADGRALACGAGAPSMRTGREPGPGPVVVKVWDLSADPPRERATLEGLDFEVSTVAFSPDGATLVAGGFGARAITWDVASGRRRATLQASCTHLYTLAFAPDGRTLAAGGLSPSLTLWDTETWSPSDRLDGRRATRLAYVPDGRTLAVGFDDGTVALRDVKEERTRLVLQSATFQGYGVTALAVARDGGLVAAGFERGGVWRWDPASGALRSGFGFHHLGEVTALAFAPDGRGMASGGKEGVVRLWTSDPAPREIVALPGHAGRVAGLAFAPDGKTLASAGSDGLVKLWDVAGRRERMSVPVHASRVPKSRVEEVVIDGHPATRSVPVPGEFEDRPIPLESLALAADGAMLATGDGGYTTGGQISLRDMATGRERLAFAHERETMAFMVNVVALAFSPDGRRLASAGYGTVQVADASTGRVLHILKRPGFGPIRDLAFAPDGRSVSACGWPAVWTWDLPAEGPRPGPGGQ